MKQGLTHHIFKCWMLLLLPLVFLMTCGKSEFSTSTADQGDSVPAAKQFSNTTCSTYSLRKPQVDVVIIWSNTRHSNAYVSGNLKRNIAGLLNEITNFDYRVLAF
ncbi:MAG: hypothetical protein J6Y94_05715, partial [Bacteriovoracaceae bacterium]|nr:hypothetical protein [Bacteriovoracaceae bacterium]